MEPIIRWLHDAPWYLATVVLLLENVIIFLLAVWGGHWLIKRYRDRRVAYFPEALNASEVTLAGSNVVLNTIITLLGLALWRAGFIRFRTDTGWWAWFDVLVLLTFMDLAMYWLHRVAHISWVYPWMHRLHHLFDKPRPMTLFVLHPLENFAFGSLWLVVVCVYEASWLGMSVYLTLNVLFGTIGHLGVEPLPPSWPRLPLLRNVAGATFHARHHQNIQYNYGFYTIVWDRLFGTLSPDYWLTFARLPVP